MKVSVCEQRLALRLFLAVDVGDAVRDEVARVVSLMNEAVAAASVPPRVTWVARNAVHLTLSFLGEVAERDVAELSKRLTDPMNVEPFEVEWHGLGAFPSPRHPRTLWIGVSKGAKELGRLESALSRRLHRAEVDAQPYRPHLTFGRVRTPGAGVNWDTPVSEYRRAGRSDRGAAGHALSQHVVAAGAALY